MMGSRAFQKATIEVRSPQPGVAVVVLAGEHDLYSEDELRHLLAVSLARSDHLIVDLSAAEFIDSTIVAVLVQTMRSATELDRKLNLVLGTAPAVKRILEITRLIPLLGVVPTVERALASWSPLQTEWLGTLSEGEDLALSGGAAALRRAPQVSRLHSDETRR